LTEKLLEDNCLYCFFVGSSNWEKHGVVSIKNLLKKCNFGNVIADLKDKHIICSKLWFVAVETGSVGTRCAHVYLFKYKSQIKDAIRQAEVIRIMES
jgi:hypothetical protein